MKKLPSTMNPPPASETQNIEERIRVRAYELFEARGRKEGRELDDWLQAESETKGTAACAAA